MRRPTLFVMRHGPALDRAPSGRDIDRELSEEGRLVVQRSAEALLVGPRPERIYASPYRRATQTAAILSAALSVDWEEREELGAEEPPPTHLAAEWGRSTTCLLVGHMPSVAALVHALATSPEGDPNVRHALRGGFRTGMVAQLQLVEVGWSLMQVIDPHQLL